MKQIIINAEKKVRQFTRVFALTLLISAYACSGGSDSSDDTPPPVVEDPTAATLVFPNNNTECNEGTNPSSTESTVEFEWNAGNHTDSYGLVLKDLNTQISSTYSTSSPFREIRIKRGNPYSWYIVSKSNSSTQTATSPTWKFYNAGDGVSAYAPFPAEVDSPEVGSSVDSGEVTLKWTGSDVDNDIENYDVYFGESNPPSEYQTEITDELLGGLYVTSGTTYYWSILTRDSNGNTSMSDVFSFSVN